MPFTIGDLLERTATGDEAAFSALYDDVSARVLGLVRRILIDSAQSEEVTQDVFLEIWQTAARFDASRGNAIGWILTMARRRAIDRVRSSQSSRERDLKIGARDIDIAFDPVTESIEISMEHERVMAALQNLTPLQRESILLTYTSGLSMTESAELLSVPVGTVKTRVRDGLIRLRLELAA
jgi:RNA polymerase sigma-70 factor (ECF subfamily)